MNAVPDPILAALDAALAGRKKSAAGETWPGSADGESRLSRVLSGQLGIPARLLRFALRAPAGQQLLDAMRHEAETDPAEVRRDVRNTLQAIATQLELELGRLDDAEAREREQKMVRVDPRRPVERRHG